MNTSTGKTPVLFISHGAPTFAIEPGELGPNLTSLGRDLTAVNAVLVVSPHWQSQEMKVMTTPAPETIHDFGGFPSALYDLQYPAAGHPALAAEAGRRLEDAGWTVGFDAQRGLDHGAWVPLLHLLPKADVPVFQVSMPHRLDTVSAFQLGRALAPMREQGVMIVGSGSMTHNLYEYRHSSTNKAAYAVEFARWIRQAVTSNNAEALMNYRRLAPHAQRAHPTEEHFLPLLVAMGANAGDEAVRVIDGGDVVNGVLSMESYAWGTARIVARNTTPDEAVPA